MKAALLSALQISHARYIPPSFFFLSLKELSKILFAEHELLDCVQGADIVFYGDSIIGAWRGTSCGQSCAPTCTGDPELFQSYFGNFSSLILGVAGEARSSSFRLKWNLTNTSLVA